MYIEWVHRNEKVTLNGTNNSTRITYLGDNAIITSSAKVCLLIEGNVGDGVTIKLGKNSSLIFFPGVKIGKRFMVEIGGSEAYIAMHSTPIPSDAKLTPKPE